MRISPRLLQSLTEATLCRYRPCAVVQPHASAWGYFHARANPKLTHGAEALRAANGQHRGD
jgi:hypothetical protein